MTREELEAMLNTLPVDVTFVDKEDTVRHFSQSKERLLPRVKAINRTQSTAVPPWKKRTCSGAGIVRFQAWWERLSRVLDRSGRKKGVHQVFRRAGL